MAYSLTSLVDKVRQTLTGSVAQSPTTFSNLGNRVVGGYNEVAKALPLVPTTQTMSSMVNSPAAQSAFRAGAGFMGTLNEGPKVLAQGLKQLAYTPFGISDSQLKSSQANTLASEATKNTNLGAQLKKPTLSAMGQKQFGQAQDLYTQAGNIGQQAVSDVGFGSIKSAAPVFGAGYFLSNPLIPAISGALGAGINKFQGKDAATGFGEGMGTALKQSAFLQVTNPLTGALVGGVQDAIKGPVARFLTTRVAQGSANVIENRVLAKAFSQPINTFDDLTAFAMGALLPAGDQRQQWRDLKKQWKELPSEVRQFISDASEKLNVGMKPAKKTWVMGPDRQKPYTEMPTILYDRMNAMRAKHPTMIGALDNLITNNSKKKFLITPEDQVPITKGLPDFKFKAPQVPQVKSIEKVSENPQALIEPLEKQQAQLRTIQDQSPSVEKPGGALAVGSSPYFNTDRLNISDRAKGTVRLAIEDVKPQIEAKVGRKLTNKEVMNVANNTASVLDKSVSRAETAAWEAKMLKARQQLSKQASDGTVTEDFINNLIAIKSQGTDIARKLQSLSIGAEPSEVTAKQAILEAVMKVTDNVDDIVAKSKGVDFNNYEQASQFYRHFVKPKASDWVDMIRYSSMLSSPNTHINNFSSNAQGTGIIAPIEKTVSGGVDWFLSAVNPNRERTRFAGEGIAYSKGYVSKLGEAWTNFKDTLSGKKMSSMQELHSIPLTEKGTIGRAAENTLSYPGKLLQAADEFFQTLTSGGVESQLKYRESKGLKARNIQGQAYLEARKRLFNSEFGLKEDGPVLKALEFIPMKVAEARASSNPVISTIAKYSFPFVKIPSNLLKASVEYSPAGLATIPGAGDKITQLSKAMLGTAVGIGTATLVGGDRMTWSEPTDPKKKELFRAAGMQPYSVKIGDSWYSYSKMHPAVSFNLALIAAIRDAEKNQLLDASQVDTLLEGAAKWVNFYADQSYVKNIGDMVSATKGDYESITKGLSNYPQQLVPFRALLGWIARMTDPYQRKVDPTGTILEKQLQQLMTQIPGLSQSVPARLGPDNTPIENQNRVLNAFSPVRVTNEVTENKTLYNEAVQKSKETKQKSADKKQTYENSPDAPQGILDRAALYARALPTDPENAIKALFTQEVARKMRGNALILERKKGINTERDGLIRDHLVPLGIGGNNADSNVAPQTKEASKSKDILENKLIRQLEKGEITKEEATKQIKDWATTYGVGAQAAVESNTASKPTLKVGKKTKVTKVSDLQPISEPTYTGKEELDKRLTSEYNAKIAKQGRDIMSLYDAGTITANVAGRLLDNLKLKKQSLAKSKKPGAPKMKAGRRISIKVAPAPKIRTLKIKSFSPKAIKKKPLRLGKMRVRLS